MYALLYKNNSHTSEICYIKSKNYQGKENTKLMHVQHKMEKSSRMEAVESSGTMENFNERNKRYSQEFQVAITMRKAWNLWLSPRKRRNKGLPKLLTLVEHWTTDLRLILTKSNHPKRKKGGYTHSCLYFALRHEYWCIQLQGMTEFS